MSAPSSVLKVKVKPAGRVPARASEPKNDWETERASELTEQMTEQASAQVNKHATLGELIPVSPPDSLRTVISPAAFHQTGQPRNEVPRVTCQ